MYRGEVCEGGGGRARAKARFIGLSGQGLKPLLIRLRVAKDLEVDVDVHVDLHGLAVFHRGLEAVLAHGFDGFFVETQANASHTRTCEGTPCSSTHR